MRIPTTNSNLKAKNRNILLPNVPSRPGLPGIKSAGFHTFSDAMDHKDEKHFGLKENILGRLAHRFHMHEIWTQVRATTYSLDSRLVSASVCNCAMDADGSGINHYLTKIFEYFRDDFKTFKQGKGTRGNWEVSINFGYRFRRDVR